MPKKHPSTRREVWTSALRRELWPLRSMLNGYHDKLTLQSDVNGGGRAYESPRTQPNSSSSSYISSARNTVDERGATPVSARYSPQEDALAAVLAAARAAAARAAAARASAWGDTVSAEAPASGAVAVNGVDAAVRNDFSPKVLSPRGEPPKSPTLKMRRKDKYRRTLSAEKNRAEAVRQGAPRLAYSTHRPVATYVFALFRFVAEDEDRLAVAFAAHATPSPSTIISPLEPCITPRRGSSSKQELVTSVGQQKLQQKGFGCVLCVAPRR